MNDHSSEKSIGRSRFFYLALGLLFLVFLLSLNTDFAQFSERRDTGIPNGFFWMVFTVDVCIVLSLVLIYLYRKAGAFLFPCFVLAHFFLHNFYLSTTLFSDLNLLFVYFAAGLLVIIPRWNVFK